MEYTNNVHDSGLLLQVCIANKPDFGSISIVNANICTHMYVCTYMHKAM